MSDTRTLETIDCTTPSDLAVGLLRLFSAAATASGRDIDPDEFYFDDGEPRRIALVEKTLTDGSKVYNVAIASPAPATLDADEELRIRQGYADGQLSDDEDDEDEDEDGL